MPDINATHVQTWIDNGCPADSSEFLARPSAQTYPNTFVMMWQGVTLNGLKYDHLCLDVHYAGDKIEAGRAVQALGGLWVKGLTGALNPEQDPNMRQDLLNKVPAISPDPSTLNRFGKY